MRTIKDGLIIIFGLLGLVSIQAWERLLKRNISYYDWPNRSLGEYKGAVDAVYRAKAKHNPTA